MNIVQKQVKNDKLKTDIIEAGIEKIYIEADLYIKSDQILQVITHVGAVCVAKQKWNN